MGISERIKKTTQQTTQEWFPMLSTYSKQLTQMFVRKKTTLIHDMAQWQATKIIYIRLGAFLI